mgnify:CR=1 FL=1
MTSDNPTTFEPGQQVWHFGERDVAPATIASVHGPVVQIKIFDGKKTVTIATKRESLSPRDGDNWPRIPIHLQQQVVKREIGKRESCYPKWIEERKITSHRAAFEIQGMKSIAETLDTHRHIETSLLRWERGEITEGNAVRAIAKLFEIGEVGA